MDGCSPARCELASGEEDGDAFVHRASIRSGDARSRPMRRARPVFSHDDLEAGRQLFDLVSSQIALAPFRFGVGRGTSWAGRQSPK